MSAPVLFSTTLIPITCGACSVPFALPQHYLNKLKNTGEWFWCPNGHEIRYAKTENERLKQKIERLKREKGYEQARVEQQRNRADYHERRAAALKGHATRLRNRVAKGKCPCCSKAFADVEKHMAAAHPGYGTENP